MNTDDIRVVICCAIKDIDFARKLYKNLRQEGLHPWLNYEDLVPGMNWKDELINAVKNSSYLLLLISSNSVSEQGVVHEELRTA